MQLSQMDLGILERQVHPPKRENASLGGTEVLRHQFSEGQVPPAIVAAAPSPTAYREIQVPSDRRSRMTVQAAVEAYLTDAVTRGVAHATQTKLTTIFRKQFLAWTRSQGLEYPDEIDLDVLLNFRSTWSDAPLAKQKKQTGQIRARCQ